jgi:hypothetical protein
MRISFEFVTAIVLLFLLLVLAGASVGLYYRLSR